MTSQEMDDLIEEMVREGLICDSGLRRPDRIRDGDARSGLLLQR